MAGKGLYRVHQFSKVEMFVLATPQQSEALHQELIDIEAEMFEELGLHFKVHCAVCCQCIHDEIVGKIMQCNNVARPGPALQGACGKSTLSKTRSATRRVRILLACSPTHQRTLVLPCHPDPQVLDMPSGDLGAPAYRGRTLNAHRPTPETECYSTPWFDARVYPSALRIPWADLGRACA